MLGHFWLNRPLFLFQATVEEINNAFRHLSKIYHPDKHVQPDKKKKAEEIFNKLRKAHDGMLVISLSHHHNIFKMVTLIPLQL